MTYSFRRARQEDIDSIRANSTENGKVDQDTINNSDEMRTMLYNEEPIMVIGCVRYSGDENLDTLGVWGMFSKNINQHTRAAVKFCKDLIFSRVGTRFIVLIDETNPLFIRFVEFFGFKRTKLVEESQGTVYNVYVKEN